MYYGIRMPNLNLLRRHRAACDGKHPADSFSTEVEERRRGWTKCDCKIYAHGTLNGIAKKFATKARDWDGAREAVAPFLAAGSWDVARTQPPPPSPEQGHKSLNGVQPDPAPGTKIDEAITACLKRHEKARSAKNTIKKYREVLGLMKRFGDGLGLLYVEQWTRPFVRRLVDSWDNEQLTKTKKLSVLKGFFKPYVEDGVIQENPAKITLQINNRASREREGTNSKQKSPFSDAELARMLAACRDFGRPTELRRWARTGEARSLTGERSKNRPLVNIAAYREYHRKWTGEDLADFVNLETFTGLRISDAATFHAERLQSDGTVKVRCTKNGKWVRVWVPEWVQEMIRRRAAIHGPLIFGKHTTTDVNSIADYWRKKLNALWETCGPWDETPTPHRFRHTFVRILLQRGVSVARVAELVGDTEQMIRKHYDGWIQERQDELTQEVKRAFADVPRYHHQA